MRRAACLMLALLLCGPALPGCTGDDVEEEIYPVHVRVYNSHATDSFTISIGDHDYGNVGPGSKTDYAEFEPLGSYAIVVDSVKASKNLNTGSGGLYTLEIPVKGDIDTWDVVAD
ncbi:MAG TPA: hypothetical protein PKY31_00090 [Spirochaetota bacterium]|nr:hypothetical protein [Spirochaetota bacterium]